MKKVTVLTKILFVVVFLISFNGYSQPCTKPETKVTHPTCISNTGTIEFTYPLNVDATTNYQYSIDEGVTYQSSPIFKGLTPKYYKIRVKDLISGCETPTGYHFATVDNVQVVKVDDVGCTSGTGTIEFLAPLDIDGTTNYEYSIDNGVTYQSSPVFKVLSAGSYNTKVRDLVNGCVTSTVVRTVKAAPVAPTQSPFLFCDGARSTSTAAAFDFDNVGQSSFVYSYSIDGGPTISHGLSLPSHIAVVGATQGQPVTFTIYWNNVCAPSQTITCYPKCVTPVTPKFNAVAAICKGEALSPLPTKSLNGVLGTWSPALNNTVTTTYTFTPVTAGECATNATMTIVVNPETVPIFNAAAPICMGDTLSALPTVSNNGINGIWSPAPNNTTPTTYTFTPSMGQCATITTMTIAVYSKQNLIITNPNAVCAPNTVDITSASVTAGSTGGGTLTYWTNAAATTVLSNPSAITTGGTYYIKSTDGTCYDIKPVVVTINPTPILSITNPNPVCSPVTVDITLPAVTAGSTGGGALTYWTDATATTALVSPTAISTSGTYYIKSTLGTCSNIKPVAAKINPSPTLIITNPAAICSPNTINIASPSVTAGSTGGGALSYWTNAAATVVLSNPATVVNSGTYYIKSKLGACFDIKPVMVTINPSPVLSITNPNPVCSPAAVDITLPAITAGSAGGGTLTYWTDAATTAALVSPTVISTSGTYYIKSTLGTCSDVKPVVVFITTTPVLVINNPTAVCSPSTVNIALPLVTAGSTGGGSLSYWTDAAATSALINPGSVKISGTYYIKSTANTCFDIKPVVVTVNPSPSLIITNPAEVCSPNTVDITLPTVTAGSTGGGTLSYWTNASATSVLANPSAISVSGTYFIKSTLGSCSDVKPVIVKISASFTVTMPQPLQSCDFENDGDSIFNLTQAINSITGGGSYNVTFHETQVAADTDGAKIPAPSSYESISKTIYVRVESFFNTCYEVVPLQLIVNPSPVATEPSVYELCDSTGVTGTESFDLTTKIPQILGIYSPLTHKVDFYNNLGDAHLGNSANSITNVANYISGTKSIYCRLEIIATGCYDVVILSLKVNPMPNVVQPLAPIFACDADNDGYAFFNLGNPTLINSILGTNQSPGNFTVSFYETSSGANPLTNVGEQSLPLSNYQNITTPVQKIYIRVVNNLTGCVNPTGELSLNVEQSASASGPQIYSACDSYNNPADAVALIDLTQFETAILNGQNPSKFLLSYYNNQADALTNKNPISSALITKAYITKPNTDKVWVKVINSNAPECYAITTINISIINSPNPIITTSNDVSTICVDFNTNIVERALILQSGITNPSGFNFEWYEDNSVTPIPGAKGPTYTVSTAGPTRNYKVRVTSRKPPYCSTTSLPFEVSQSGPATPIGTGYTVADAFSDNQIITVKVEGYGTYEYSLDDGPRQTSNVFENVGAGEHTVYVWDVKGGEASCPETVIANIQVIDYPKYFTPNGDGFNDTWNIVLDGQTGAMIYIFDRYGKLLKQVFPSQPGWDGMYNGRMLPSDDYWFTLEYAEDGMTKNFKSHFALKR